MKKTTTENKKTSTNNVIVTYETPQGRKCCGRYKTKENAIKTINSNKWNSPKNLGWKVIEIKELH